MYYTKQIDDNNIYGKLQAIYTAIFVHYSEYLNIIYILLIYMSTYLALKL